MSRAAMKALGLVEVISRTATDGMGAMEAAAAAGLDKTTASRLLRMLTEHGWLMRDPTTRRYFPGRVLVGVAQATGFAQETRTLIEAAIVPLGERVVETVSLHQRTGALRLCVAGSESRQEIRTGLQIGDSKPLPLGATGKVILAFCDPDLQAQVLAEQPDDETRAQVSEQMESVREHGYLSTDSDVTVGVGAVSVPVFTAMGVYGALTVAGPVSRFVAARRQDCVPHLFETANQIAQLLGCPADRYAEWWPPSARGSEVAVDGR